MSCVYRTDQGLVFRSENNAARLRLNRANRPIPGVFVLDAVPDSTAGATFSATEQNIRPDSFWQRQLPWLVQTALSEVPGPLKKDLSARVVDRFFVD